MHCLFKNVKTIIAKTLFTALPLAAVTIQANAASDINLIGSGSASSANLMTVVAQAIPVKPTKDQAICLKREYSEDHLRQYPKQKLSSMYIILRKSKDPMAEPEDVNRLFTFADVIGQNAGADNEYYANLNSKCQFSADGNAYCQMSCDEGSFNIVPRTADVVIRVDKDTSFILYRPGFYPYSSQSDDGTIELDGTDKHNASYRLYSAPVQECVEARKRAKRPSGTCDIRVKL